RLDLFQRNWVNSSLLRSGDQHAHASLDAEEKETGIVEDTSLEGVDNLMDGNGEDKDEAKGEEYQQGQGHGKREEIQKDGVSGGRERSDRHGFSTWADGSRSWASGVTDLTALEVEIQAMAGHLGCFSDEEDEGDEPDDDNSAGDHIEEEEADQVLRKHRGVSSVMTGDGARWQQIAGSSSDDDIMNNGVFEDAYSFDDNSSVGVGIGEGYSDPFTARPIATIEADEFFLAIDRKYANNGMAISTGAHTIFAFDLGTSDAHEVGGAHIRERAQEGPVPDPGGESYPREHSGNDAHPHMLPGGFTAGRRGSRVLGNGAMLELVAPLRADEQG
ncbi:unnamed protein product, partial [Discosporangium mesarthrocarpum]